MRTIIILLLMMIATVSDSYAQDTAMPAGKTVSIQSKGCSLVGSLVSSENKQKIVIIIAGSGPTDRNGNNPMGVTANSYKMIADELGKNGIASFRYDKRGIGKSIHADFKESNLVFDDYINDAIKIFDYLKDTLGYSDIYIIGHSEGSLIGMIAAQQRPVKGYMSLSGAGRPIDEIIMEQLSNQHQPATIVGQVNSIFGSLKKGQKTDSVPQYLYSLFRPSVQPYMISWLKYAPAVEIGKLHCPVLILQGACDIQVMVKDAENLHQGNVNSKLDIIPAMTHTLKDAGENCKDEGQKTYKDATLPLDTRMMAALLSFIQEKK